MSPLEAARRLRDMDPWYENERAGTFFCIACGAYEDHLGRRHRSDCPLLAMRKIVSALEAAERITAEMPQAEGHDECFYCGGWSEHHEPDCPWQTLVAALKDKEAE